MTRRHIAVPTPYTTQLAYSRVVVDGDDAWISGCAPLDADGRLVGGQSAYLQARQCLDNIAKALALADMRLSDLVRIRIYLRSFADLEAVCRAEREALFEIRPAATVIGVQDLVARDILVYIDADARRAR